LLFMRIAEIEMKEENDAYGVSIDVIAEFA